MNQTFIIKQNKNKKYYIAEEKKFFFLNFYDPYKEMIDKNDGSYEYKTKEFNTHSQASQFIKNNLKWKNK